MHVPVHEMFRLSAERFADRAAIEWEGHRVSYRQLESQAARLAQRLRDAGAERGSLVAIVASRTADVIAAMLAVLHAGCAFVPIDLRFPAATLPSVVAEAGPRLWLVGEGEAGALEQLQREHGFAATVLTIEEGWICDRGEDLRLAPPAEEGDPDALSYVYFTSGSTGRPKGIMGRLQAIDHFIRWEMETFGVGEGTRVSQLTSPAFDAFLRDAFTPLAAGGIVCAPAGRDSILDGNQLAAWIEDQGVEILHCTPTLFRLILGQELAPESLPALRWVLLAGEPLLPSDVRRWHDLFAERIRLVNLYGPSETTMVKLFHIVRPEDGHARTVPIGRPMPGARVAVVDEKGKPCPPGKLGEIYIRTRYRSLGYLNRPDLTAESFVQNPLSDRPDDIIYKTGDLGRLQEDGTLECVGRRDTQVKVRGVRVEIAPIEDLLRTEESVADVAVVDRVDTQGNKFLCAYVVPRGELDPAALAGALRAKLPDSAVPSAFVTLETLPRTLSGKVDRRALPNPGQAGGQIGGEHAAPRTPVEAALCRIFSDLLAIPQMGIQASFFELGGHSVLATMLLSRIRSVLGVEVPLREVFRTPAVEGLARTVVRLRAEQEVAEERIPRRSRELDPPPLSYAQQRLWFIDQLEPDSPLYNMPVALRAEGPLRPEVLALTLGEITRRHEALRTVFAAPHGSPVQVIQPAAPFVLPLVDLSGLPASRREAEAHLLAGEEAGRPFDLVRGPLLRGVLLRLAAEDHAALLTMHHIASDAWSMGILVREVAALYPALSEGIAGRPSPLPELPVQYADFAVWQSSWLLGGILAQEIAFWRRQLAGLPPLLELPTDRSRPAVQSFRGAARPVRLPAELTRQAELLGQREGATLFMVLLAAFQALLARTSGQQDLAVGTPITGRNREEIEGLIGFFVNTLVMRGDLSGDLLTFRELLGRVRETALAAYQHQNVPFEKLVEELAPERSLSHPPLFQVTLVLQNAPAESLEIRDLRLRPVSLEGTTAKFDLTLNLAENAGGLAGVVEYATDLFDGTTIDRLILHYERLLAAAVARPERVAAELPLLSPAERHQALAEWNDTGVEGWEGPVTSLVERWCREQPDAPAVVDAEGRALTYGDLGERSGRLAAFLRRLGVGPESIVAVLMERSVDLLVAQLGVLKAGAAYLSLDPAHPAERLAFMLEETAASVVLTRESLDRDREEITRCAPLPAVAVEPDHLAYVLFTSGSTGRPKGVQIPHRGLMNLVRWDLCTYGTGPGDHRTQVASLGFDASVWEIWPCLASGAVLHLPEEEVRLDPRKLSAWMAGRGITVSFLPTPLAEAVMTPGVGEIPTLRHLLTGGDRLRRRPDPSCGFTLVNHYGPTEVSVVTCAGPVAPQDRGKAETAPSLGRPIDGLRVYLLDRSLVAVAPGAPGELWIGGPALARGYLGDPAGTAERFVPDPFGPAAGGRLYRTGDLGRHRHDGRLEFIGRTDHQVKVRGFRIELGEIEAALERAGAREAVVVAREEAGGWRLVAYVAGDAAPDALRRSLREQLPDYMVPSAFVMLPALPLTAHGKVDRKALPAPEGQGGEDPELRTPLEEILAGIWCEVLGRDRIGPDDDFFALGGHSLLATQVISRVSRLGAAPPLRALFDRPTVRGFAELVGALLASPGLAPPAIVPVPRTGTIPLSFAQQRLWFLDQMVPGNPFYNMPATLRFRGPLDVPALAASLGEVIRRHESLRTTFRVVQGHPVQHIAPPPPPGLPAVDLSGLPGAARAAEADRLAVEESLRPFDLARGPLLRMALAKLDATEHLLLATLHHIVTDGWSTGVLCSELASLYQAFAAGRPSPLPELAIQHADFAVWQRQWLSGEVLADQLGYWRERLADPPPLNLPTDRPRPAVSTFRGDLLQTMIPAELWAALGVLGRRCGATSYMVLLAAWKTLLLRESGQSDLLVGTPIANRNRVEIEGLIGFFVNTLALRTDLSGDPSFAALVERVREVSLGAYIHQDLPFEKLVEELHPERDTSRNPLFQVSFVLQNFPFQSMQLSGLSLQSVAVHHTTAKFDLTLYLFESGQGLPTAIEYSTDLFDRPTIRRLLDRYLNILTAVAADPELRIGRLPVLTEPEQHQVLREWNDVPGYAGRGCLDELVAAQAARTPAAPAVVFGETTLTYAQLVARATAVARWLRGHGCGPESRVGIALERSLELPVALLGTLVAGAAWVPLDPESPCERLAVLLEDARPTAFLTAERSRSRLPDLGAPVLSLDDEGWPQETADITESRGAGDDRRLAYVLYTSGSTGRPKGVMVPHRAIVNRLLWMQDVFPLTAADAVLQKTPFSFDASIWELFSPLLAGARLVMAPPGAHRDPAALAGEIIAHGVTVLQLVPSMLGPFLDEGKTRECTSLTRLFCGGELLPSALRDRLFAHLDAGLCNLYGPTECAIDATFQVCRRDGGVAAGPAIPIGRPLSNVQVYLLDDALQPTALGVPGELCVGGVAPARGYLGRPALTAERFVPDPFSAEPGGRLYRSGDLARHRPDGAVEFLGRIDHQVKIRGFRIEPGEIESALAAHAAVREAAVIAREDAPGDHRLVAYVALEPEAAAAPAGDSSWSAEQVEQWRSVFDSSYGQHASETDPAFDITGWNSAYTGLPIPAEEMSEWVDGTVGRILAERPRRVLEIGCGTGLLLFRIAPHVERYRATDFSAVAVASLRRRLEGRGLPGVELERRRADDFSGVEPGSFDAVVLNSVVQYFPGVDYLVEVLEKAAAALAPGGFIFLGDLRSRPLLPALHASVELHRAEAGLSVLELARRVRRAAAADEELVLDPDLFLALRRHLPGIGQAEIQLRRGTTHNELTRFRYDAVLRARPERRTESSVLWDWRRAVLSPAALREQLEREAPDLVELSAVPNARLAGQVELLAQLSSGGKERVEELRLGLRGVESGAVDPEQLWELEEALPYRVTISESAAGPGLMDVRLARRDSPSPAGSFPAREVPLRPWRTWANDPLAGKLARSFVPQLRDALAQRLPEHMVPGAFVLLDALPRLPSGKLDRRALPDPEWQIHAEIEQPRTPVEEILAGLWAELLGVERIGRGSHFFDLGGHSLLATRVISRLNSTFGIEMPLRDLFAAPVLADLAVRVDAAQRAGAGRIVPPLVPVPREGPLPLSFAQQRLWFLHQMDPLSPVYNMPFDFRLSGPLDIPALAASLTGVVRRHETLRTTLPILDGEPFQVIAPPAAQPLPVVDLSALPVETREALAFELGREESARPFDLARPPVVRTLLLRLDERDHALLFTIHHVSGDGWSVDVLARELVELYGAAAEGTPSRLPDLPVQYADFAVWQRSWLQGEVLDEQIEYWRGQLAGAPALLEMPLDRPRPPVQSFRGRRSRHQLPAELSGSLLKLGRSQGATGFMTLLAGFQALLHRYSGQESVVVGTPIANRERTELERLIGFFANSLALRAGFAGDPGFTELLAQVRETALGAYAHQDLPFEKLVDELAPQRHMNYAPVFQVLFVYQNAPQRMKGLRDLTLRPFGPDQGAARFDLTLVCSEIPSGLGIHLDYNSDLFEEATAGRLLRLFAHWLTRAAAEPQRPVGALPLLDEEEHLQVVLAGNEASSARPGEELGLHGLFLRQAALTPEAPALITEDGAVRYGELAAWADRIAGRLQRLGLGAEDRAGVCLERSPAAIAALLGAMLAGAAYVPLDPEWPRERLAAVAADAGFAALLTRAGLPASGLAPHEVLVEELRQGAPAEVPRYSPVSPETAAYVIYTSGSTGAAKGVVATHRAAANFVHGLAEVLDLGPADRLLLFAPLSFDASVLQIFPALARGAALVLHPNPRELTAEDILGLCARHGITVLDLPAALWRQWVEEVAAARLLLPASLRAFLTGGESVPAARLLTWASLAPPSASFLSSYGPTEATVTTTIWQTTGARAAALAAPQVPIGRPLPNARVYVLDRELRPVPGGVAGELFLGGLGLARGYLGRPDLTAESFVPDPLSREPGGRLYQTGDLGRRRTDGELEFLGRADHQVKIRGFRVEPGEIETALTHFPGVRQALVTVREDVPGDPRLIAYAVPRDGAPLDPAALRAFLAERLPYYMIPAAFIPLADLPVLPSGKLDRAALPAPAAERTASFVPPRDPLEQILAQIWAQVLKLDQVGAFDNFFELGGHSLTATQAVARIRQTFAIDVQLRSLFEDPTVAGLAETLRRSSDGARVAETAALRVELAGLTDAEVEALLMAETAAEKGLEP
jgi:amino acid adenylation domain-containing protein